VAASMEGRKKQCFDAMQISLDASYAVLGDI